VEKCEKFIVSGVVQGVGFRYFTSHQGLKLGLTGYTKNLYNGDVEVVGCGKPEKLDKLFEWLHQGSPMAQVDKVTRSEYSCEKPFRGFAIY
jgi:acylphosphatase